MIAPPLPSRRAFRAVAAAVFFGQSAYIEDKLAVRAGILAVMSFQSKTSLRHSYRRSPLTETKSSPSNKRPVELQAGVRCQGNSDG
jgi:hypothetical protein